MSEELLKSKDIDTGFKQMGSEAVSQGMDGSRFVNAGFFLASLKALWMVLVLTGLSNLLLGNRKEVGR